MKYRTFGRLTWRPSALGFGAMRLPILDEDPGHVDEAEAIRMIRYAIDHGVNYVDTAYPYHRGESERVVGCALQDGYRERVKLATKLPAWLVKAQDDCDRYLNEQLERLQTDHIDFYLLHSLGKKTWTQLLAVDALAWAERALADGRIGHLGFSFHDELPVFQEIVDGYDNWTFCQIQYNFMDVDYQAGTAGLHYAAGKGLAVVVMEPLRGGRLTKQPPQVIEDLWTEAPRLTSPADAALRWVWNQPEVSVVLSGMSTMPQVQENIASADRSGPGTLSAEELALFDRVREAYLKLSPIPCTNCQYCLPCPNGVNIPRVFEVYNDGVMYGDMGAARFTYNNFVPQAQQASQCVECGQCEELCPQGIAIIQWLKTAHEALAATG
ncbi:MAG: aldo/keto reductase [Chloroflexi bacterium]|nr:aldo/keto reductase [Chloroflexota bacterium]MBU1747300.1 aldo/keto reductase [Chloroflexota bacterium]MBU1877331.1 aldo/keto reductase [Chloroflexota bacterium]